MVVKSYGTHSTYLDNFQLNKIARLGINKSGLCLWQSYLYTWNSIPGKPQKLLNHFLGINKVVILKIMVQRDVWHKPNLFRCNIPQWSNLFDVKPSWFQCEFVCISKWNHINLILVGTNFLQIPKQGHILYHIPDHRVFWPHWLEEEGKNRLGYFLIFYTVWFFTSLNATYVFWHLS